MQKLLLIFQPESGVSLSIALICLLGLLSNLWGCKPKKEIQKDAVDAQEMRESIPLKPMDVEALAHKELGEDLEFVYNDSQTFVVAYTTELDPKGKLGAFNQSSAKVYEVATGKSFFHQQMVGAQMEWVSDTKLHIWQLGRIKGGSQLLIFDTETQKLVPKGGRKRYR
ncbi:MAG: hypothetical protein AAF694_04430 [Bacteroidota bacterium]